MAALLSLSLSLCVYFFHTKRKAYYGDELWQRISRRPDLNGPQAYADIAPKITLSA